MDQLAQWLTVLIGVLVTAVVRFPNFTPARMIGLWASAVSPNDTNWRSFTAA